MDDCFSKAPTLKSLQIRSLVCVPLMAADKVIGVIYLDSRKTNQQFDQNHLQVMTGVANLTSLALENIRHWDELREENRSLRAEIDFEHGMVGSSPRIREILDVIQRVAPTTSTVLIQGESGTGKELVARAIHCNSPRAERQVCCHQLCGDDRVAVGKRVVRSRKGRFHRSGQAKAGESGGRRRRNTVSGRDRRNGARAAGKAFRVLQDRVFERVGGRQIPVNVRLYAATNKNLQERHGIAAVPPGLVFPHQRSRGQCTAASRSAEVAPRCLRIPCCENLVARTGVQKRGFTEEAIAALRPINGRATFENWKTPSSEPSFWVRRRNLPEDLPDALFETSSLNVRSGSEIPRSRQGEQAATSAAGLGAGERILRRRRENPWIAPQFLAAAGS